MESLSTLEVRVTGSFAGNQLTPATYDIRDIIPILSSVDDLLCSEKKDRPLVTYDLSEGSVRHVFKTSSNIVIALSLLISKIDTDKSIDFLDIKKVKAIEVMQNMAYSKQYTFNITTSLNQNTFLEISPLTNYIHKNNLLLEMEYYFFGTVMNAGGKISSNIHLDTKDFGLVTIATSKEILENHTENIVYKEIGIRAIGKQSLSGELDKGSFKLIEIMNHNYRFDQDYMLKLKNASSNGWSNINPDEWLSKFRDND